MPDSLKIPKMPTPDQACADGSRSAGSYAASKNMTVDFGYAHLFVSDAPINRTGALQDKSVGTFKNRLMHEYHRVVDLHDVWVVAC
jgi:hypothetical protein